MVKKKLGDGLEGEGESTLRQGGQAPTAFCDKTIVSKKVPMVTSPPPDLLLTRSGYNPLASLPPPAPSWLGPPPGELVTRAGHRNSICVHRPLRTL